MVFFLEYSWVVFSSVSVFSFVDFADFYSLRCIQIARHLAAKIGTFSLFFDVMGRLCYR